MVFGGVVVTNAFNFQQDSIGIGLGWGRRRRGSIP